MKSPRRKETDPMMEGDVRRESAIPVQGRISIIELAKMCKYWEEVEGVGIDSMGKLLSWSVSALCNLLEVNEKMPEGIDSVASAHRYLTGKGLYQKSLESRSRKKISAAIKLETLRDQGIDPREYIPREHNMVNNKHSVEVYDGPNLRTGPVNREDVEMARKMIELNRKRMPGEYIVDQSTKDANEERKKYKDAELKTAIESMRSQGRLAEESTGGFREGMSDEELREYNEDREKDIIARENAPIDIEEMKRMGQVS